MDNIRYRIVFSFLFILGVLNFFVWSYLYEDGKLKVSFLDVGQGDAILIVSPSKNTMLIDGGPDRVVLEKLGKELGFLKKRINFLMVSNPDKDHIAGFIDVFDRFKVDNVILPGTVTDTDVYQVFLEKIESEGSKIFLARRGQVVDFGDGAFLSVLFPDRNVSSLDTNTGSIVAKLSFGESSILFTGDTPGEIESYLTLADRDFLKSDILKVAHHGSKYSSFVNFLDVVKPTYAVISSGKDNKYGHPHNDVLKNLASVGAIIFRTDNDGTLRFRSNGNVFEKI